MRTRASILVGLLWCLALLSFVVIGVLHTARLDLHVGKHFSDRIQARYLALAGVEKAKALLYQDSRERSRSSRNHSGQWSDAPGEFQNVPLGRGSFQVFRRGRDDEGGGVLYGISDEESRLNVNTASIEALGKINGMTPDIAAAIVDWRDGDNAASAGGAEAEYYLGLQPPRQPRNGPLESVRELLMVRGVSPASLLGNDRHCNGLLDSEDTDGRDVFWNEHVTADEMGWAALLTAHSSVANVNAAGQERVNAQSADEAALEKVQGITAEIARAIVSYRGQNQFQSIADLLDVTPNAGNSPTNARTGGGNRPSGPASSGSGPKVISADLLMEIADDLTVSSDEALSGAININTASLEVLLCLPGIDRPLAQGIIAHRQSSGFFPNTAWLLKVPGMTTDVFKQVAPLVSARSETFRIFSEGKVASSGVRQRIEAIVHIGSSEIRTRWYREADL